MEPLLGEIRWFGFNFAPRGWAFCEGQLLAVAQYSALFSLLGTTYGGDGRTSFALPDLRGRMMMGFGRGPGLSTRMVGQKSGREEITLDVLNLPSHTHQARLTNPATTEAGNTADPTGALFGNTGDFDGEYNNNPEAPTVPMKQSVTVMNTGNSMPFNNLPPHLVMNPCIALVGVFPSRS
jgi:microcystin-dependent protein